MQPEDTMMSGWYREQTSAVRERTSEPGHQVLDGQKRWNASGVIQGYEDVLFLHKKGPAEILIPATIFSLTGHMDEASARLPFALANLATLLAIFLLGWQLLGPLAGWTAALLLAFDGYLIAFARFVQYQSIVLLTSVLTVLILYRLLRRPKAWANYLTLAAILLATGLLSHYDAALAAVPAGFLFMVLAWQQRLRWRALLSALLPALLVGMSTARTLRTTQWTRASSR